jgi:hypothetical protein
VTAATDQATAVEVRQLFLRIYAATATAAEAKRIGKAPPEQSRSAEAAALRLLERFRITS